MISYRPTPWDTRAFGFKTAELTFETNQDQKSLTERYLQLENELLQNEIRFIYTRIDGQDFELRKNLQELGFYFAESSLEIAMTKVQKFTKLRLPPLQYLDATKEDIPTIKLIARDTFNYSRFHEDATIDKSLARSRYFNWIDDLVHQKASFKVAYSGKVLIGFNIQKEDSENRTANLVLAGCDDGQQVFVLSLWNEIIEHNKAQGIQKIETLISTSNIGMYNVYAHFGFKVEKTLFGFHKWID